MIAKQWAAIKTRNGAHVVPVADAIEHDLTDDCICGPQLEHLTTNNGGDAWLTTHQSLDRREEQEPAT